MKKKLFSISTCLLASVCINANAQTFPIGHVSINFKDASRSTTGYSVSGGVAMTGTGRTIGSEVYYPATVAGNNTAVAIGQFPVVVFGHGFAMSYDAYDNVYNKLASMGYVVILPRTEGSIFPTPAHAEFGSDLKTLAIQGLDLNTTALPGSTVSFVGKILQKSAIGGHSMGAGASYLAAAGNSSVTCVFNFAAATTNPSSITAAATVNVPLLVISGQKDNVADTNVQNSHYATATSTKKFHTIIRDVTHCDFGNGTSSTCTFGQAACSTPNCNTLLFNRYMAYLEPFLANQLKGDCAEGNRFMDSLAVNTYNRVGTKQTGSIGCAVNSINTIVNAKNVELYPNPASETIAVKYTTSKTLATAINVYNITGRLLLSTTNMGVGATVSNVSVAYLTNGVYTVVISNDEGTNSIKLVKE
jgi:dienelactone hydrolase